MKKFLNWVNKLNFKKATIVYLILSALLLIACFSAVAYLMKDKIYLGYDFVRISKMVERQGETDNVKTRLNKLVADSANAKNAIIVDKNNNITFKTNNSIVGNSSKFELIPYASYRQTFQDAGNPKVIYKVIRGDDIFSDDSFVMHLKGRDGDSELYDDFSFMEDLSSKEVYLLNYQVDRKTGDKIFIIRNVDPIHYTKRIIETIGLVLIPILALYWIGLALWVYRDADRKQANAALWGLLVLLSNLVGLIIYTMVRQNSKVCYKCGVMQGKENTYCIKCGAALNNLCGNCGSIVSKNNVYCGKCGNKIEADNSNKSKATM